MDSTNLSPREERRRSFILSGNLWGVVATITFPLAVYAVFNYLYAFFDTILAGRIGSDAVASLLIFDDIKAVVSAIGIGIAAAGTVFVARHYGAGEYEEARRHAGAMLWLSLVASTVFAIVVMVFWKPLLAVLSTPDEVVASGLGYYLVQMASTVVLAFNSVYMGVERAKGNTAMILALNVVAMLVKMALSAWFVLGLGFGMTAVAVATLIAQGLLSILAAVALFRRGNSIAVRARDVRYAKDYSLPIFRVALPVIGGKMLFSLGRVFVNAIGTAYGTSALAAFSLAMKTGSAAGSLASVFEDPTTAITSQNLGARKLRRAFSTWGVAMTLSALLGFAGVFVLTFFLEDFALLFTGGDASLVPLVSTIFAWERFSVVTSAVIVITAGFFLGFKITKVTFILNLIRLFFLRIPTLLVALKLGVGPVAFGYAMFVSNTGTALIALFMIALFHRRVKNFGYREMSLSDV
ncbi:MAG: MATE family efflux transporter [Candidatus Izemoplasmatales bacterium]